MALAQNYECRLRQVCAREGELESADGKNSNEQWKEVLGPKKRDEILHDLQREIKLMIGKTLPIINRIRRDIWRFSMYACWICRPKRYRVVH